MNRILDREEIAGELGRFFAHRPAVRLAYLFGSVAAGRQTRESDTDVAVLFDEGYTSSGAAAGWSRCTSGPG
jgi:predicted nucleotidyltransferase